MSKNMPSKIYIPVDEKFNLHGKLFQCIKDDGTGIPCYKCAFHSLEPHFCNSVSCLLNERPDKRKVHFINSNSD